MKNLTFKDKKSVDFTDGSDIEKLTTVVASFADLDAIKAEFEKEDNLIGGTFEKEIISQRIYTGVTASAGEHGNITAVFTTRPYTHDEIVDSRLADLEDTIASM